MPPLTTLMQKTMSIHPYVFGSVKHSLTWLHLNSARQLWTQGNWWNPPVF